MTMKVAEFIEWLKTQPQDAEVMVISHTSGSSYYDQGGNIQVVAFNPEESAPGKYDPTFELDDFSRDSFKNSPFYGKKQLLLGSHE